MNRDKLLFDLERDEANRLKPYRDSVGKLTIGIGRNLDDRGISHAESLFLAKNDISIVEFELDRGQPWWRQMPEEGQRALANMCFNLGYPKLLEFRKMLDALKRGDYDAAVREALDSRWAKQVGDRAKRVTSLFLACKI